MQTKFNFKELQTIPAKINGLRKRISIKDLRTIPKRFKALNRRSKILVVALGIVIILGGVFLFRTLGNEPAAPQVVTGVVQKGDVKKVITATGTANLSQVMPLSFEEGGTIKEIFVKDGDVVVAGQPLVQLDTTTLEQELKEATENLASAQASYEQSIGDLSRRVKSNLVKAEKTLFDAKKNADPYYLENQYYLAEMNLKAASERLVKAQGAGESDTYQLQVALSQAQLNLMDMRNKKEGGAAKDLEIAQADYEAALKSAQDFERGMSNEYLSARASLTQSETKLLTAQENLDQAALLAPMAGTIITGDIELYQNVGENTTVISLVADPKDFTVSASVDQADIASIRVGQKVNMTLDTVPNEVIPGTVSGVSLKGTNTQNVITYGIKIDVDNPSDLLRDKMSVNVSIIIQEVKDVLIIPSRALVTRGKMTGVLVPKGEAGTAQNPGVPNQGTGQRPNSGQSPSQGQTPNQGSGQRPSNGQFPSQGQGSAQGQTPQFSSSVGTSNTAGASSDYQFVPIEIGLNDGTNVEVKSGLSEGQVIIIQISQQGTGTGTGGSNSSTQRPSGFGAPVGGATRILR